MNAVAVAPALEEPIALETETLKATASDVAALAYRLWQERGCPMGSPEDDWYRAEELLLVAVSETGK